LSSFVFFFFSSRRRHTRFSRDWSSDVCSSDLKHSLSTKKLFILKSGSIINLLNLVPGKPRSFEYRDKTFFIAMYKYSSKSNLIRSEERRVGKDCRSRLSQWQ